MPAPTYHARGGWLAGDWVEIGSKFSWAQIAGNFRWEELQAGPIPDADLEELQFTRKVATMFDRLSTGECRAQLDNSRGQYTGNKSAQNLLNYSENLASGTYYITDAAATSLDVLVGRSDAIDAAALSEDNANSTHGLRSPSSVQVTTSGGLVMVAGDFYAGTRDRMRLLLGDNAESSEFHADFSLRSMLITNVAQANSASVIGASMTALGNDWVRCWVVGRVPGPAARARVYLVNSAGATSYTGTGSAWMGVRGLQVAFGEYLPNEMVSTYGQPVLPVGAQINANDVFTLKAIDGSSVYNLFSGYVEQWGFNPALKDGRKMTLSCSDVAERLRPIISTSLMVNVTHRNILQTVMSAAAIDPLQYQIDQMNDLAAFAFLDQVSAGQALALVQQNGAQVYMVDGAGRLHLKNRHWNATSDTAVASFAVGFNGSLVMDMSDILNRVEVRTTPRKAIPDVSTVGWVTEAVFVPAASTKQFILDYVDPFTNESGCPVLNVQDLVRGEDYKFNEAPTGGGADMTSQVAVTCSASATAANIVVSNPGPGNGYLWVCQIKGSPVSKQPDLARLLEDDDSIARYQERYTNIQADLLGTENRIRDLASFILTDRSRPKYRLSWSLKNEWPAVHAVDLLAACYVSNSLSNVGSVFLVNELEHTITFNNGPEHVLGMKLELAPVRNWFTLSSPTLGRLNFNRLGV